MSEGANDDELVDAEDEVEEDLLDFDEGDDLEP